MFEGKSEVGFACAPKHQKNQFSQKFEIIFQMSRCRKLDKKSMNFCRNKAEFFTDHEMSNFAQIGFCMQAEKSKKSIFSKICNCFPNVSLQKV